MLVQHPLEKNIQCYAYDKQDILIYLCTNTCIFRFLHPSTVLRSDVVSLLGIATFVGHSVLEVQPEKRSELPGTGNPLWLQTASLVVRTSRSLLNAVWDVWWWFKLKYLWLQWSRLLFGDSGCSYEFMPCDYFCDFVTSLDEWPQERELLKQPRTFGSRLLLLLSWTGLLWVSICFNGTWPAFWTIPHCCCLCFEISTPFPKACAWIDF